MRLELKDIKNRLSLVENGNNEKSVLNEMENIKALLPLRKVAHVDEFNKKLKTSQETKLLFVSIFNVVKFFMFIFLSLYRETK